MAKKKIEIKGRWVGYTPSGGSRIEDQEEALRLLRRRTCFECEHEQSSDGPCEKCGGSCEWRGRGNE